MRRWTSWLVLQSRKGRAMYKSRMRLQHPQVNLPIATCGVCSGGLSASIGQNLTNQAAHRRQRCMHRPPLESKPSCARLLQYKDNTSACRMPQVLSMSPPDSPSNLVCRNVAGKVSLAIPIPQRWRLVLLVLVPGMFVVSVAAGGGVFDTSLMNRFEILAHSTI